MKTLTQSKFDILGELNNLCVKIPLLQEINCVPIYNKIIKELCIKRLGRNKKDQAPLSLL
jgi:hypothetical protein